MYLNLTLMQLANCFSVPQILLTSNTAMKLVWSGNWIPVGTHIIVVSGSVIAMVTRLRDSTDDTLQPRKHQSGMWTVDAPCIVTNTMFVDCVKCNT